MMHCWWRWCCCTQTAGSYDRQADTWHNGARVYTREGGPPGSEYEHEHSNGGGSSAAAMHLHFHVTKGGSCYWRIGSNLTAPNKDQSIRALTGPNCRWVCCAYSSHQ